MIRIAGLAVVSVMLAGCFVWSAGKDPVGMDLKDVAERAIFGVKAYQAKRGQLPDSLESLVPEFMPASLPLGEMRYNPSERGSVSFAYSPSWPQSGKAICSTNIEEISWKCVGFL
jgi:hypothetical protein